MNADYKMHWDEKFKSRRWGRYPPEDLVRFMGRQFGQSQPQEISVLEVGCGPGANLWFLHREGYRVAGIDGSPTAIENARKRLDTENSGLNKIAPDLKVGDFSRLPWADQSFDVVIDIFAIYANTLNVISSTVQEIDRVLKPGGLVYSKLWGRKTTGYGEGIRIEEGTYDQIPSGPCKDMGISHFFDQDEISQVFGCFEIRAIDVITRTDFLKQGSIEEFHCQLSKPLSDRRNKL